MRVPNVENKNLDNKIVFDIGLGEFDHHQKNRNGKRKNGIYYSSIGLLWQKFGREYLEKINVRYINKVFEYIDSELIQYIDAADNMQIEYLKNKLVPDFIKLYNPEWNEDISEDEAFMNAIEFANEFWQRYIKHAIAEVEATEIIIKKLEENTECYLVLDKEMPYKKAIELAKTKTKYIIFKSRREGYDIRTVKDYKFNDNLLMINDINVLRKKTNCR